MENDRRRGDLRKMSAGAALIIVVTTIPEAAGGGDVSIVKTAQCHQVVQWVVSLGDKTGRFSIPYQTERALHEIKMVRCVDRGAEKLGAAPQINWRIHGDGTIRLWVRTIVTFTQVQQQGIAAQGKSKGNNGATAPVPGFGENGAKITGHATMVGPPCQPAPLAAATMVHRPHFHPARQA